MSVANVEDAVWTRSTNRNVDQLHAFLTGEMYDCSFKVGKPPNCKVFKCHKFMLSVTSCVFHAMLYGNFNEANKSPDDPIHLEETDPEAFESAMRFIYGGQEIFRDTALAIQLYRFAHKMQIPSLIAPVEVYLSMELNHSNVISIYDTFNLIENNEALLKCNEILVQNAKPALDSDCWLEASAGTLESILQMDELSVDEEDIFKALIKWAKAQLVQDGAEDDQNESMLRAKLEGLLKVVRFESLSSKQAAALCSMTKIFSLEEQHSILLATVLDDIQYLPRCLAVVQKRPYRMGYIYFSLNYTTSEPKGENVQSLIFSFSVSRKVLLCRFSLCSDFYVTGLQNEFIVIDCGWHSSSTFLKNELAYYETEDKSGVTLYPGTQYELMFPSVARKKTFSKVYKHINPPCDSSSLVTKIFESSMPVSQFYFRDC